MTETRLGRGGHCPRQSGRLLTGSVVAAAIVILAACGSPGAIRSSPFVTPASPVPSRGASTLPPVTAPVATTAPRSSVAGYEVQIGTVQGLGKVLVDGEGRTLYLFEPDAQSGQSTCTGECINAWPPLLLPFGVSKPVAGPGVRQSLLGTTRRADGTTQVTYDRWPLYLWVGDLRPGQATGQALYNLGGLWYVLAPDGRAITRHL
ncbi:MAG: COG4315 family predicted lipoprotein [Acidimicrobiales bacterium]